MAQEGIGSVIQMVSSMFGGVQDQSGVTVNVAPPISMAQEGYGSPDLPMVEGAFDQIDDIAYGESDIKIREVNYSLDPMQLDQDLDNLGYGMPDAYGNVWSRVKGAVKAGTGKTAQNLAAVGARLDDLINSTRNLAKKVVKNHNDIKKVSRRSNAAYYMSKQCAAKYNEYFGEKGQYLRATLSAAQAIPGIRALNLLESEQLDDLLKYFAEVTDAAADYLPKAKTSATVYTLRAPAGASPTVDELADRDEELLVAVNALREDVRSLSQIVATSGGKEAVADLQDALEATMLSTIAKVAPSQIINKQEAMAQAVIKHVGSQVGDGSGTLSLSLF